MITAHPEGGLTYTGRIDELLMREMPGKIMNEIAQACAADFMNEMKNGTIPGIHINEAEIKEAMLKIIAQKMVDLHFDIKPKEKKAERKEEWR